MFPKELSVHRVIDGDGDRAFRSPIIYRRDLYIDTITRTDVLRPLVFERLVATAIEAGILREMVERIRRSIETTGNVVAAIIGREAIATAGAMRRCNLEGPI